jgi:hypothetical protein
VALIDASLQTATHPSCLQLHSNETIQGIGGGAGLFLAASSNCIMISNAVTGNPAATFETNMALYDLTLNENNSNQSQFEQGLNTNGWLEGIWFGGFNNLLLRNINMHNSSRFAFVVSNFTGLVYSNVRNLQDSTSVPNTDALHIWGPANWIDGDGLRSNGTDDTIALNTDEGVCIFNQCAAVIGIFNNGSGWGSTVNRFPQSGGNISNATFNNNFFDSAFDGVRFYGTPTTGGTTVLSNITISNSYGTITNHVMNNSGVTASGPISFINWFVSGSFNSIIGPDPLLITGITAGTSTTGGNTPNSVGGGLPITVGPTTTGSERMFFGPSYFAFNRNAGAGGIYNSSAYAYQYTHNPSATQANDYLCLTTFKPGGASQNNFSLCDTGFGFIGVGTDVPAWQFSVGAGASNTAGFDSAGILHSAVGTAIASASTITVISPVTHITGTTTINVMLVSAGCAVSGTGCQVTVIPDGLWSTATGGGNGGFAIATTAVVGQPIVFTFDNATQLWYPTYGLSVATTPRHQMYWNVQSALFSTVTAISTAYLEDNAVTLKAITARLSGTISCTVAPTIAILDLGTSVTTVYGSATVLASLATGTADGAFTSTGLSNAIAGGHYIGMGFSAGTCVTAPTMDISAEIQ